MRTTADLLATYAAIIPAHNGDERDATSRSARRHLAALTIPGVTKKTKIRMHRRDRHNTRRVLAAAR